VLKWFRRKESEQEVKADLSGSEATEVEPEAKEPLEFATEPPTKGAWLETRDRNGQSLFLFLRSPLVLGTSEDCDVRLDERFEGVEEVKPQHVRIELWRDRWVIVPLDRDAAVFVNSKRTGENVLRDGVEIRLGENGVRFVFREGRSRE
jgi:hypothetical protein